MGCATTKGPKNKNLRLATSTDSAYDQLYGIRLVGDEGVGKTTLLLQFSEGKFILDHPEGVDMKTKTYQLQKKAIKVQVWDTAGQERYRTLTQSYYRNADCLLLVYDVSSPISAKHLTEWLREVKSYASDEVILVVVANKIDLEAKVDKNDMKIFAEKNGCLFAEVSSKTGKNIEEMFSTILAIALDQT